MISIFSYGRNRDLLYTGCSCQAPNGAPPCHFCTSLTEKEGNILWNDGLNALREYVHYRDNKNERRKKMKEQYWIGFDFDGTISYSESDKTNPMNGMEITHMANLMTSYHNAGIKVKIITARPKEEWVIIREFLEDNLLPYFEITNSKDKWMRVFYDDRAITTIRNEGVTCLDLANKIIQYESDNNNRDTLTRDIDWVTIVGVANMLKTSIENQFSPLNISK